ncbi:type II secretion system F family protein [Chitinimonas sp. PSY-7]|uniref:type II secretion system F family protein n=1 Tax=Chitinimonas sp. PSY-7 TaxID=3459088 RepID=UPI00403FD1B0
MTTAFYAPMPYRVRAELFLNLAEMERAGVPALKAYGLLQVPPAYQVRLDSTRKMLARGVDPAFAGQRNGLFTPLEASLLKVALAAGSPAPTYRRLRDNYVTKVQHMQQIRARMAMPVLMLFAALLIQPLPALFSGAISVTG